MCCVFVSNGDVQIAERLLKNAPAVKGLSKCHSIRAFNGSVYMRTMSCYNDCCSDNPSCPGGEKTPINISGAPSEASNESEVLEENVTPVYEIGAKVETAYNGKVYGGVIEKFDEDFQEYWIKFLKKNRAGEYVHAKNTWSSWIPVADIIKVIE